MTLTSSGPTWERDGRGVNKPRETVMVVYATIGAKALYLLFIWLLSASGAAWMAQRKGYGERLGLTFGLILSAVGFLIVLLLPGRPGSAWKVEGPIPRRHGHAPQPPRRMLRLTPAPASSPDPPPSA